MFLDSIILVQTLPCLAESGKLIVVGKPSRPLDEVLPYLATLPGVIAYNPSAGALTFRRHPGLLTLNSERVYITQVADVNEGLELLAEAREAGLAGDDVVEADDPLSVGRLSLISVGQVFAIASSSAAEGELPP